MPGRPGSGVLIAADLQAYGVREVGNARLDGLVQVEGSPSLASPGVEEVHEPPLPFPMAHAPRELIRSAAGGIDARGVEQAVVPGQDQGLPAGANVNEVGVKKAADALSPLTKPLGPTAFRVLGNGGLDPVGVERGVHHRALCL